MQKVNGNLVYSASDLVNFLECQQITHLDLRNFDEKLEKTVAGEQAKLIQEKGIAHEKAFLTKLTQQHPNSVIDIVVACPNREAQYEATTKAMQDGVSIIYQASFRSGGFLGYADFLRRVEVPSHLGTYSYEIIDTKLSTKARGKYLIQLCLYAELLAEIQGITPAYTYVVLGSGTEQSFRVADYMHYFQSLKIRFLDFINNSTPIYPTPCEKCDLCHWKERCNKRWNDDDHLSRVANISKVHIRRLEAAGINTLKKLGSLPENAKVQKISEHVLSRLREQASLQLQVRTTPNEPPRQPIYKILTPPIDIGVKPYGFSRMPKENPGDMFFDMEGNPMEDGGLEYLFGLYIFDNGKPQFKPFWAHNRAEEKIAFEKFIDFVSDRLKTYPDAYIYHYAPYETTAIKRLMGMHGTRELEVDDLLRKRKFVDLYRVVRESIRISEPSYSIKYLEHFYAQAREGDVQNAGASIVFYEKWKATQDQSILDAIAKYNEDDVRSTFELREWLLDLKTEAKHTKWFDLTLMAQEETTNSTNKIIEVSEKNQAIAQIKSKLQSALPIDSKSWTHEQQTRNLVAQLLEFFRRTAKSQLWAMFERQTMTVDEQLEDMECIANLTPHATCIPHKVNRSIRYTFTYPEQDFKVKPGNGNVIAQTLKIVSDLKIDETTKTVSFKIASTRQLPEGPLTIMTGWPINTDKLEDAVLRHAKSLLSHAATFQSSYKAIDSYLLRNTPQIDGLNVSDRIIAGRVQTEQIIDTALRMNETYLFLQGPPGAGKTYNGSEMILKLIQENKRVGVTSNSHKAINNLLQAIDEKANKQGLAFKGFKRSKLEEKDQLINGVYIKDTDKDSDCFSHDTQLIAGTAWLFAREELDQELDYVFIDEAGQISLAHLIAIGCAAKNIILLGDQMQLSQPIQGSHPDNSGLSSLDYLLEGKATIPPEQGIFLDTTRRMHSKVCKFISDVVYDSRLEADPSTDARALILDDKAHPSLKPAGISFVPITHDGNAQRSEEEALIAHEIYQNLLKQSFKTASGETKKLEPENILVVAPYNAQVNLLITKLGPDARVGTVDKFQGQEAEVVIFSMTTSSEEELPRDMEFLFSRNRLNVAISRAKCLSIMLASPALLNIECKKPEQMALVNTICWLKEYAATS
jgi:predicted RecB family nuclease